MIIMFRKRKIVLFLIGILSLCALPIQAQKASVSATIDPAQILIGEQAVITLEIKAPKGRTIATPEYNYTDTLITGIEVLAKLDPDTTINHDVMSIRQRYIVTSFDSALYNIPYMYIIDGTDTIRSRNLGLKVSSPELSDSTMTYLNMMKEQQTDSIDFEALQLADIKDVQKPPFVWQDYLWIIFICIGIFLLLVLCGILLFLYLRKKNKGYYFRPKVVLPPHVVALKALDKIKANKLCQQGLEKQFYTELTDTLRNYIEKRYYIKALEQTSDETLEAINNISDDDSVYHNLKQILKLADLVKFAKYKPLPNENDLSLMNAYFFVNQTKKEEEVPATEAVNTNVAIVQQIPPQEQRTEGDENNQVKQ
ncbi:hypothetical protein M2132_001906 [Dysgonomonas sp. PH5-45]|nr:hypothetical protein [Dysgonomonas sp. PH5-45]MDH6388458.1 hypothetical protein [Dysgonomonas sp. PH5-37]